MCVALVCELGHSPHTTVENCLAYTDAKSIELVAKESSEEVNAWHVYVTSKYDESLDFWIDAARPPRLIKQARGSDVVLSKFDDAHPEDSIPIEIKARNDRNLLEQRFIRGKTRFNVPVDPASWTLASLGIVIGTAVNDNRIYRRIGYWDASGLTQCPPRRTAQLVRTEQPRYPKRLWELVETDRKSAFALEAATWIILNTPDGPEVEKAAELIRSEHTQSTNLVYLCKGLVRLRHHCAKQLLQSVLERVPMPRFKARLALRSRAF
jgi:hypothetical protein